VIADTNKTGWLIMALMIAASVFAYVAKPSTRLADQRSGVSVASIVPRQFGDWREEPQPRALIVNPQTQELLEKLYSEVVERVYVNSAGYRIMLSVAYGSDQRGVLQAHKPEVCYPAQGFTLEKNVSVVLMTPYGEIPARRLNTVMQARREPVTYWFTVGDRAVQGMLQKRLVDLRFGLTGRIPVGLLFRVSSIDADPPRAFGYQDQFINDLLSSVSLAERKRLSGLGGI